jgi:phosphatidylserine/phosphatidylglycerophosphate/cardiolipin synthase-like enzyme
LVEEENIHESYFWPGIDYSNSRIKDFDNLNDYVKECVPRDTCARMPWHDIAVYLTGPVVGDLSRHFVERWNYARTIVNFRHSKTHTITYGNICITPVKGNRSHVPTIKSSSQGSTYNANHSNTVANNTPSINMKYHI